MDIKAPSKKFWIYAFLVYWGITIVIYEKVLQKIKPITHGNEELHKKFPAFRRDDKHWFTRRLLYYSLSWTFLPRFLIVVTGLAIMWAGCTLLAIGLPKGKNVKITGLRYILLRLVMAIGSRITIFGITNAWWVRRIRPKVCYKKYLGEDWKPDYDGIASTVVANH